MDEDLNISWNDNAWVPMLNPANIMDYFARSKFYDRQCNNETIRMQRQNPEHLMNMTGVEFKLFHTQPPILYVIRKQYRRSPESVTPMSHYYVIAGTIYKSPDLGTLINTRMLNTSFNLSAALNKAIKHARYHPSKGYWWDFNDDKSKGEDVEPPKEQASWFQRQRVDLLIGELTRQYPMKVSLPATQSAEPDVKQDIESTPKNENLKRELDDGDLNTGQPSSKLARIKTERGTT